MTTLPRLRFIRTRKALTQQQLAEKASLNRVTISRLEAGSDQPFPTTVRKLADALGVLPEDLMEPMSGSASRPTTEAQLSSALPAVIRQAVPARFDEYGSDVEGFLRQDSELAALVDEAARELVRLIPGARLSLQVLADPDFGFDQQMFLGVSTDLSDDDALEALRRFDQSWWVRHVGQARGLLCIDLIYQ